MRWLAAALVLVLAGCVAPDDGRPARGVCSATDQPFAFHLAPGHKLEAALPPSGAQPGNGFAEAFATDDMNVWLSAPAPQTMWILDKVTVEFWARAHTGVAPIAIGGEPGTAYHFFNQFGSSSTFAPAYAVEFADAATTEGTVYHYTEEFEMPPGGFVIAKGERVRLLLTNLVPDGAEEPSFDILYGVDNPSQIRFEARCAEIPKDPEHVLVLDQVFIPGNQGLLTGAIPATEGVNQATVWFDLSANATRLDFAITQDVDANPGKDDLDLTFLDEQGNLLWSAGSPYSVESGTLWDPNLRVLFPGGTYGMRINSYSGMGATVSVRIAEYAPQ